MRDDFDPNKALLPGLPAYEDGRMSDGIYDAGQGRYIAFNDGKPYASLRERRVETLQKEARRLALCGCKTRVTELGDGRLAFDVTGRDREYHAVRDGASFTVTPRDIRPGLKLDRHCMLRAVTETTLSAFEAYAARLEAAGFEKIWTNQIENNHFCEFQKDERLIYAAFMGNSGTARFEDDTVSAPIPQLSGGAPIPGVKTQLCQFGLYYDKMISGVTADCGMLYLLRLPDNSLFIIDGGEYEQATDAAIAELMRLMRTWTDVQAGEKIRVAAWMCTHAHDDHLDVFGKLIRLHHDEMDVQRLIFNFPAFAHYEPMFSAYVALARLNEYYPNAKYLKPHAGQEMTLAGVKLQFLQTHEDSVGAGGNELIGGFNDTSLVVKISFDGVSFLVLGDMNRDAERILLENYHETLHATAVQPAHHLFNLLPHAYEVIGADIALIPTNFRNVGAEDPRYQNLLRGIPRESMCFAAEGTTIWEARDGKLLLVERLPVVGGPFDGTGV